MQKLVRPGAVVTLTGAPGIGKSRLGLEVARKHLQTGREVAWVPLADAREEDGLVVLLARALAGGEGVSGVEDLCTLIGERHLLLVADDCDHLTTPLREILDVVLARCEGVSVLSTSREALGISAERVWTVKPLSLPPAAPRSVEEIADSEAGWLFLERAREAVGLVGHDPWDPGRVARICRELDGIALALELAAGRLRVLTLAQIDARLDGGLDLLAGSRARSPAHHHSMRAAVAWTVDRMTGPDARLLEALSVVRGGCSIEAVEAIGAADVPGGQDVVLDALASLVDRSLVRMTEWRSVARYSILEPVRWFATERLGRAGAAGPQQRHARFYLSLAEGAMTRMEQLEPAPALLAELEAELPNLRAALDWSAAQEPSVALRLHASLAWYWVASGRWLEGATRLQAARTLAGGADDALRARLLSGSASVAWLLHDVETAEACARESVELWRRLNGLQEVARSLALLAQVQADAGEEDTARASSDESLALARELSDPWVLTWVLASRGAVFRTLGQLEEAEGVFAELAAVSQPANSGPASVWLLEAPLGRAAVAIMDGDPGRAAVHALTAARAARSMDRRWYWARTLLAGAVVAARSGGAESAAACVGALDRIDGDDTPLLRHEQVLLWDLKRELSRQLSTEAYDEAGARGAAMGVEEALCLVEAHLEGVVEIGTRRAPAHPAGAPRTGMAAPHLRIDALGPLEIEVGGTPLAEDAWAYAKPRELLIYLACHPEGRTREQVGLAFWPEASTAQVKNRFHVALHRLRRVLRSPRAIVVDRDRYRVNPDWVLSFDADGFEGRVKAALDGAGRTPFDRKTRGELADALKLYRGDFLESESAGDWHLDRRDRCRNLFLNGQSFLAESLLEEGALAEAAEGFERMIRVDDLSETGYRGLMRSRAAAGDRASALRLYARLENTLRTELGALPEASTRRLAEELRGST